VDFSAAVRLQLKPKQSQPLVDSVDSGLPVLALGEQQEELQEACCKWLSLCSSRLIAYILIIPSGGGQSTTQQQQQQQPQKPTLSLFGQPAPAQTTQPLQQSTATSTVIPGVKVDVSNLLPTTKFESCADEIRSQIEAIDKHILNQMKMCHEVGDLLPTIEKQGATIPNDVEFVQGKLETMQHALENDASDIDGLRSLVTRDAAEAQVAFRAIDTLKLPLQYQSTGGGWWSVQDQQIPERSMRSSRKNTLALPDGVEGDASTDVNGVPVNLVDYFSHRSKEMKGVLTRYTGNLKEIEDHLHGVEATLNRQISDFVSSKSREGAAGTPRSTISELSGVLSDVEAGIMGVATRLSNVSEQVQDLSIGQQSLGDGRLHLG
jgi:nucleoporin p58/p45